MNGHHGAVHLCIRDVALADGIQLCGDGILCGVQVLGLNAAVHLHEVLCLVVVCGAVIAQAHLFPDVGEQLGAGCAAQEHCHHLQRIAVGIGGFPAHDHFALVLRKCLPYHSRFCLAGAGVEELHRCHAAVFDGGESLFQGVSQLRHSCRTHKVDFDLCSAEQFLECRISGCRCQSLCGAAAAVAGERCRFAGEGSLIGLRNGILPLFVDLCVNAVQQVHLLDAELGVVESAVRHIGLENAAQHDLQQLCENRFAVQRIAVSDGGRAQGDGLDIALFGNGAAQISPVEQMQLAVHCRIGGIGFAAGNHKAPGEGAGSGSLFRQRLQKLDAQVIGL